MDYRKLPHGEEEISVIGLGTSSIGAAGDKEIEAVMTLALEKGINYFDMASADAAPFPALEGHWQDNGKMFIFKSISAPIMKAANTDGRLIWI